jgi:hypothetical protein
MGRWSSAGAFLPQKDTVLEMALESHVVLGALLTLPRCGDASCTIRGIIRAAIRQLRRL